MDSIRGEVALANAQELMNVRPKLIAAVRMVDRPEQKANDKCFAKCITKPGTSLSYSEEVCIFAFVSNY